jgi:hypothetical protein
MELYITVLISVLSVGGFISMFSGYNLYKSLKQTEKEIEILKIMIVDQINTETRDRSVYQV